MGKVVAPLILETHNPHAEAPVCPSGWIEVDNALVDMGMGYPGNRRTCLSQKRSCSVLYFESVNPHTQPSNCPPSWSEVAISPATKGGSNWFYRRACTRC